MLLGDESSMASPPLLAGVSRGASHVQGRHRCSLGAAIRARVSAGIGRRFLAVECNEQPHLNGSIIAKERGARRAQENG